MWIAEIAGTVIFAISGIFAVAGRNLDWFGALVVGVVTAIGGGSIRDLLLDNAPVFWIDQRGYLLAAAVGAVVGIGLARYMAHGQARRVARRVARNFERMLQMADAAGLALFAVVGANIALDLGFSGLVAVVMGLVTAVGGGVIRDLLADRTPLVLSSEIYATAALAGATAFVVLSEMTAVGQPAAAVAGAAIVVGLRAAGIYKQLSLPPLHPPRRD